jgi:hypothetical protein
MGEKEALLPFAHAYNLLATLIVEADQGFRGHTKNGLYPRLSREHKKRLLNKAVRKKLEYIALAGFIPRRFVEFLSQARPQKE